MEGLQTTVSFGPNDGPGRERLREEVVQHGPEARTDPLVAATGRRAVMERPIPTSGCRVRTTSHRSHFQEGRMGANDRKERATVPLGAGGGGARETNKPAPGGGWTAGKKKAVQGYRTPNSADTPLSTRRRSRSRRPCCKCVEMTLEHK